MFEIVKNTDLVVVVKNNAKTLLDIAEHPYLSLNHEYYSITKGKNHVFVIINKNGSKCDFSWGENGHTIISDTLEMLKKNVVDFVISQGICLDVQTTEKPSAAHLYYNDSFHKWQATLFFENIDGQEYYRSSKARDELELHKEISKVFGVTFSELEYYIAPTGIDAWKCEREDM